MEIDGFLLLFFFSRDAWFQSLKLGSFAWDYWEVSYIYSNSGVFLSPENNGIHGRYDVVLKGVIFVQQPNVNDFSCL